MNILIVRLGSIGDIVHTLPALAALRRRFPDARIDWLVESRTREILLDNPFLDHLLEVDTLGWRRKLHSGTTWKQIGDSLRALRLTPYDVVFDFQGLLKSGVLTRLARSPRRVGFGRSHLRESLSFVFTNERLSPPNGCTHVIDRNLHLLNALGIETQERVFPIEVPPEMHEKAGRQLDSMGLAEYVIVNPGGGWVTKQWSPERYGELSREIKKGWGLPSLVLWGPGEESLAKRVVGASDGMAHLAPPTGLREVIPYLTRATLFVGGDTGPFHIAGALGVPLVGVFGPSDPAKNGPFGPSDQVVWKSVDCSPCYKRRCPGFDTVCLTSIAVSDVVDAVRARLVESGK